MPKLYTERVDADFVTGRRIKRSGVDAMQVCGAGHKITSKLRSHPDQSRNFCPECGAACISKCKSCSSMIPGFDWDGHGSQSSSIPKFCYECGQPYPWTEARLVAADEFIAEIDELSSEEKTRLSEALRDIASENARTELGVIRFKKLAAKAGQAVGGSLYKMMVDVASEAAKRALLG